MDAVGDDNAASAKDALTKVYSDGDQTGIDMLYDMLIHQKKANPLNETFVGKVMENNPNLTEQPKHQAHAGLYLPPSDSGINTTAGHIEKTAQIAAVDAHLYGGPHDLRMCPKTRGVVNTYICRFHCLDGLAIDDHQVVCGEAIWRQNVMDKFSTEYRDKDGNWVGGYLEKRFVIEHNDGGHPALLKPGQRQAPIHEDAWSPEKRLQEMRRSEGKERGYSQTPGDPKGLYNFDQHDLAKGPRPSDLSSKTKDPIAKLASKDTWVRTAAKKGFNLSKKAINFMGNGMNEQSSLAGKECPGCHQKFSDEVMMCPRCNRQLTHVSLQQAQSETGGIPHDPMMASSDAVVHLANGVYKATKDGVSGFGADRVAAENSLHNNMQQRNEMMLQMMDPSMGLAVDQPIGQTLPQQAQNPQQPAINEVQDGTSHFDNQNQKPHVHPSVLEKDIQQASATMSDEEQKEMQEVANKVGLHPDNGGVNNA